MPPTPWTGETSSESSICERAFQELGREEAERACGEADDDSAPVGPTKPEAGVIVPSPATMPVTMPSTLGLP